MSHQNANNLAEAIPAEQSELAFRTSLFVLFLICGLAIFVFGSGYYTIFPTNNNLVYLASLSASFLTAAVLLKRIKASRKVLAGCFRLLCCLLYLTFLNLHGAFQ